MRADIIPGAETAHPATVKHLQEVIGQPPGCACCGSVFEDHRCRAEGIIRFLHGTATPAPVRTRIYREGPR